MHKPVPRTRRATLGIRTALTLLGLIASGCGRPSQGDAQLGIPRPLLPSVWPASDGDAREDYTACINRFLGTDETTHLELARDAVPTLVSAAKMARCTLSARDIPAQDIVGFHSRMTSMVRALVDVVKSDPTKDPEAMAALGVFGERLADIPSNDRDVADTIRMSGIILMAVFVESLDEKDDAKGKLIDEFKAQLRRELRKMGE